MRLPRPTHAGLLAVTLAGLAAALALLAAWQRDGLRAQTLAREAATLHAITTWQRALEREDVRGLGLATADQELALLALATSRLPDVLGVEVFSLDGRPVVGVGSALGIAAPGPSEWERVRRLEPFARLLPNEGGTLEVTVPLHDPDSPHVTGAVRYWLDGAAVRQEFGQIDGTLVRQALLVWLAGGATLVLGLGLVLRRLGRTENQLRARTVDLQQANRELAFAAKTSALGAVAAHLVHGLRNPVAGLATLDRTDGAEPAETVRAAGAAARRIREMVEEVVALLRDERSDLHYEVPVREVLDSVARGLAESAARRGVAVETEAADGPPLDNRAAALGGAVLRNLARNAVEAAPAGTGRVMLRASPAAGGWEFRVEDNGPGLPAAVAARPFEPTTSAKPDGAGIGLAISRQLALHLGAELRHEPAPAGTCFLLRLPPPSRSSPP
jgi:signal transduction histidine kinase